MKVTVIVSVLIIIVAAIVFWLLPEKVVPEPEVIEESKVLQKVLGLSVQGREIESYTFGNGPKHLLFIGGIHGGYEWNTVILARQVIDYLKANTDAVPENLSVTIIPSANPDGVYRVVKKEGLFLASEVSKDKQVLASGRFNARDVDLNRNFDCKWQPKSTWQTRAVSGGTAAFSEPETKIIRDFVLADKPLVVVSWHSKGNAVYASKCEGDILRETLNAMNAYSRGSGYQAVKTFDAYQTTGDSDGWLASIGIPAITVELKTHETVEFEKNLAGVKALLEHYAK